ncbi:tetratricopeptide repeat protein, partial [Hymenobacter agri]
TRPAMLPPAPGGQADLSVRSTRAEPDLVSENLARIFVRQGKTARAIEIYEKLMVKQPEKMAYFALQIQSLQPSA